MNTRQAYELALFAIRKEYRAGILSADKALTIIKPLSLAWGAARNREYREAESAGIPAAESALERRLDLALPKAMAQ